MQTTVKTIPLICFTIFLLSQSYYLTGQGTDCKVLITGISGKYSGGCRKGLAHGKGTAQGMDTYVGKFKRGLPDGTGIYTWADGSHYEGQWKAGKREGKGVMVTGDSTQTGYWKADKFLGEKVVVPYEIVRSESVARHSIMKTNRANNDIRIKLTRGGIENLGLSDLSFAYTSGNEYKLGLSTGLQNVSFPVYLKIKFRAWNHFNSVQYDVIFECNINEPAPWDINISY